MTGRSLKSGATSGSVRRRSSYHPRRPRLTAAAERPIREIEPLTKVMATWTPNSDSTFLLAKPSLIGSFAIADRAVTSGVHGGNLMCELRPGKWSKRYVVLRDNTIYLCANEKVRPSRAVRELWG